MSNTYTNKVFFSPFPIEDKDGETQRLEWVQYSTNKLAGILCGAPQGRLSVPDCADVGVSGPTSLARIEF